MVSQVEERKETKNVQLKSMHSFPQWPFRPGSDFVFGPRPGSLCNNLDDRLEYVTGEVTSTNFLIQRDMVQFSISPGNNGPFDYHINFAFQSVIQVIT